jgi:hypothetical protein
MEKYFMHNGQQQVGPFAIDELKANGLKPEMSVWKEGMENWVRADQIDELKRLFSNLTPPPFKAEVVMPQQTSAINPQPIKRKSSLRSVVVPLLIIGALVVGYFVYQNYQNRTGYNNDGGASDSRNDLVAGGNYSIGLFGQKTKIHGYIRNTSSVGYQSATIKITFLDKNSEELGTDFETVYDYFPPHASKNFEMQVRNASGTKSITIEVSSAGK